MSYTVMTWFQCKGGTVWLQFQATANFRIRNTKRNCEWALFGFQLNELKFTPNVFIKMLPSSLFSELPLYFVLCRLIFSFATKTFNFHWIPKTCASIFHLTWHELEVLQPIAMEEFYEIEKIGSEVCACGRWIVNVLHAFASFKLTSVDLICWPTRRQNINVATIAETPVS